VSLRVLLVQENTTYNGYIIRPVLETVFARCGRPNFRISPLPGRPPEGYEDAKQALRRSFASKNVMAALWLFVCDSDTQDKSAELAALEKEAQSGGVALICCAAEPEVEAWLVAGHLDKLEGKAWSELRRHVSFKEEIFEPFLKAHGNSMMRGGGRSDLMKTALQNYSGLCQRCPEIKRLEERISEFLNKDQHE